ncbi:alpha/beta hydrolase fold protein [Desulfatibacillum aliphaticivorans]|uniref:Alpha/beta hydrolase fold protein n=1 Tax=Desulfatibacillum aliphaticivorans TaxID=218208 RepID=B8FK90_DESAL|nr:alpha/beta hydrolase [Desulfatibacillum aliphaticivorans]ACL02765.1 alpha/beta hydrolase fold protein [Desulfatibacillum aliphaticivorans]
MKFFRLMLVLPLLFSMYGCSFKYNPVDYNTSIIQNEIETAGIGKSSFIEIDNLNMHFIESGEGDPIILIHGWLCWGAFWKKITPSLSEKFHVYALDLIGHGLSDKPVDDNFSYSTEAQARRVVEFMKKKSITNAVIVGHSMGGEIAAKTAIMAPDRVSAAVLICAAGMQDNPQSLPSYIRIARAMHLEPIIALFFSEPAIRQFTKDLMFYSENPMPEEFVKDVVLANLTGKNAKKAVYKVTVEGLFKDFLNERCAEMKTKTLVISATDDLIVPPAMGREYNSLLPDSTYLEFDKAGHMLPWERPEDVSRAILAFCGRVDQADSGASGKLSK